MLNNKHYYHPFKGSNFAGLLHDNSSPENDSGLFLDDVDLYYQPLQEPLTAGSFFIVRFFLVIAGEILHIRLFKLMKKENGLVSDVTKLFTITQMIFWPFWLILTTGTDFIHPLTDVVGKWYCTFTWFFFYLGWIIISFHSFIVSLLRYCFIVHSKKVEAFGKEKVQNIFFIISFLIPLLVVIWAAIEGTELNAMSFINKCYGNHHKVFLIDTSTLNVVKRNFCQFEVLETHHRLGAIVKFLRSVSCVTKVSLMLIMGFNITECFIYYKVLSHIYR